MRAPETVDNAPADPVAKSIHLTDPNLQPFLDATFDPIDYLNSTLPPLSASTSSASGRERSSQGTATVSELTTQTQTLLSQLSANTSRLSAVLTQLTDDILRSGSRLSYEVEVLRGDTIGLAETLTEGLSKDIAVFVPNGLNDPSDRAALEDDGLATNDDADSPAYVNRLRTLSLIKDRLDTVIKVFGEAMAWVLPPSEVSLTSSLISVSGPEQDIESQSREEKGREVAKSFKQEIVDLLATGKSAEDGLEAAIVRVEELRDLAQVWKGTAEEKARNKFVESLIRLIEERQKTLEKEADRKNRRAPSLAAQSQAGVTAHRTGAANGRSGLNQVDPGSEQNSRPGGYGFIDHLQRMRSGL
ncbi:MAG: hypothetical protein M1817_001914 [Caeruleum heppii]|nr:MAG: hypothetical protein M1817_001914 [Caeruleum heppii]